MGLKVRPIDSGFAVCVDDGLWPQIVRVSHLSQRSDAN